MGALYRIDFPNGKSYVGITSGTAERRFKEHLRDSASGKGTCAVNRAIRKHGASSLIFRKLVVANDWEYLCLLEQKAIAAFNTFGKSGYNMTKGGEGATGIVRSDATKARISAAKKGVPQSPDAIKARSEALLGHRVSEETKAKISEAKKGKTCSLEIRMAMSARAKGRRASDETRAKLSAVQKAVSEDTKQKRKQGLIKAGTGVSFDRARGKWAAHITINYKKKNLGRYDSEEEAKAVRAEAVRKVLAGEAL